MSSFGEELRRERELREITLREVSEATKISLRYLEALEANEFGELPGGVFNRGFVRAYSQYIGIDPETMVTSYLMEEQARSSAERSRDDANLLRRTDSFTTAPPSVVAGLTQTQLGWALAAIVVVFVLVAGLLLWSWLGPDDDESGSTVEPTGTAAAPSTLPAESKTTPPSDDGSSGPRAPTRQARAAGLTPAPTAAEPARPQPQPPAEEPVAPPSDLASANEDPPQTPASKPATDDVAAGAVRTRIHIARETSGRVNCDNTRIEMLSGVRPGTTVEFLCKRFLVVDVADAGAIEIGFGEQAPAPLGADGRRLSSHRIDLSAGVPANGGRP